MTRTAKIQKLANAVKDYLGAYGATTGIWIRAPKPKEIDRVKRCIERLNIPLDDALAKIHGFHNVTEFNAWIEKL